MTDFNGFDKGVIGKKLPSDTTLNNMKKSDLIKLLHLAESNHRVLAETYKIAVDTSKCNTCPLSLNGRDSYNKAIEDVIEHLEDLESRIVVQRNNSKTVANSETLIGMQMSVEDTLGWLKDQFKS